METLDLWRSLNALLALASAVMIGGWINYKRHDISIELQLAGLGAFLLNFTIFYGSLELAFWPQFFFRIPLVTIALIWMVFAGTYAFLNRNRDG